MIKSKVDTNKVLKEKYIDQFFDLIKDQLLYGAKKYQNDDNREATDIIADSFGIEWFLGTCLKYLLRFKNLQREKDLLKVTAYMFLVWLKMGYHLTEQHDTDTWIEQNKGNADKK